MNFHRERIGFIIAVVLYGTVGMFLRFSGLPSEAVALYRGVLGALFILLYRAVRGEKPDSAAIRRNLPILLLSGVLLGLNWIFLFAPTSKQLSLSRACATTWRRSWSSPSPRLS